MTTMTMPPNASGTQPPSMTLRRFALRNMRSTNRKGRMSAAVATSDQRHTFQTTMNAITPVTTIVPVTAMPYAEASALEERNSATSKSTPMRRNEFTRGI